ncbi:MAG: DUF4389 domain-containing protein [Mariprofundaceae bacterium]|nr:DUF4389 domain-containing protein [Mariprofundaceae bacterium]
MTDELKEHVKDSSVWVRLLFMLLFSVLYWAAEMVLAVVVVFQFFSVLFTGKKNSRVLALGAQLSTYAYQVFRYLTYNSEEKPFPLGDWPSDKALAEQAKPAPKSKPRAAPRKRAVKKAAPKPEAKEEKPTD